MTQNSKAWLTLDEIAEAIQGDYDSGGLAVYIGSGNAREVARRVARASMAKAKRLRNASEETVVRDIVFTEEPLSITETFGISPLSRLGTWAQQATEAFQGLQEASKDLVDLEIVVPSGYRTTADQKALDAMPKGPSLHAPQRPVLRGGLILNENQRPPKEPDIDKVLSDLFREPWYKRLWSWLTCPEDKPLTDSELQKATEQLDRVLQLPWHKRTPALILWLWRLP